MSYDISITSKRKCHMDRNMTSNVVAMWDEAMPDLNLRDMHDKTSAVCLPHLEAGMLDMAKNRQNYEDMEPDNGWGSYGGALAILVEMAGACRAHPDGVICIHR